MYILMRYFKPISLIGGFSERKEFAPLGSKFFPLRVTPRFEVMQLAPFKLRIKMIFYLSEGLENCKMSGKNQREVREFLRWMISGNPEKDV